MRVLMAGCPFSAFFHAGGGNGEDSALEHTGSERAEDENEREREVEREDK